MPAQRVPCPAAGFASNLVNYVSRGKHCRSRTEKCDAVINPILVPQSLALRLDLWCQLLTSVAGRFWVTF